MKILLAIDDSKFSEVAAQTLATQFRPQDAEVRVLHVIEPIILPVPPQMSAGYAPEMSEIRQDQLKKARELVAQAAQVLRAAGLREIRLSRKATSEQQSLTSRRNGVPT